MLDVGAAKVAVRSAPALARQALALPLPELAQRTAALAGRSVGDLVRRQRDLARPTYPAWQEVPAGELYRYAREVPLELLRPWRQQIAELAALHLEHRFDLLGSGWTRVEHGMRCRGLEGHRYTMGEAVRADPDGRWLVGRINAANLPAARQVWRLVSPGYRPIDWQLDFKSGYRWSERTWYRDVPYGHLAGVDVKVPWELARMQHLPLLAWAFGLAAAGEPGLAPSATYAQEFRDQVLDFIATNPPRFGVNWRTSMDVAIRAANWLLAYDLFRAQGAAFDAPFVAELRRSLFAHGQHVLRNLEWSPRLRGNHYLANVVGLLFIAAYLPRGQATDAWLAFVVREFLREAEQQFCEDGANFEASTCYHRLSAEMVIYATALVAGLPEEKRIAAQAVVASSVRGRPLSRVTSLPVFQYEGVPRPVAVPPGLLGKLDRLGWFALAVAKPSGRVHQVGDNDSGHFFKPHPRARRMMTAEARALLANLDDYGELPDDAPYWLADELDHRGVVAALAALLPRPEFSRAAREAPLDWLVAAQLSGGVTFPVPAPRGPGRIGASARVGTIADWERLRERAERVGEGSLRVTHLALPRGALGPAPALAAYPDFGLYVVRSERVYLAIRCGPIGQRGHGGHAHNDQLAVELEVDGEDWLADPGTYLYTSLPGRRNEYRASLAHFVPRVEGREPGRLDLGLFCLGNEARAECLSFGPWGFAGRHRGFGPYVYRLVAWSDERVEIVDFAEGGLRLTSLSGSEGGAGPPPFSPGYGVRLRQAGHFRLS